MPPIDRIFVITLERRKDQFKRIYQEIYSQNLQHLLVPIIAIDSQDLPHSVATKTAPSNFTDAERANFESHRACWSAVVDLECDNALILEDNCNCSNLSTIVDVLNQLRFDSLNIGAYGHRGLRVTTRGTFVADKAESDSGCWGASAYTVNQKAAREFLQGSINSFPKRVDLYISNHPHFTQHIALPPFIDVIEPKCRHSPSTVEVQDKPRQSCTSWGLVLLVVFIVAVLVRKFCYTRANTNLFF